MFRKWPFKTYLLGIALSALSTLVVTSGPALGTSFTAMNEYDEPRWVDLAPYAGRWVALVRGRVAGVGWTAEEAHRAAKRSRPKEEPRVIFVPAVEVPDDDGQPA